MIAEPYRTWVARWESTLAAVRAVGGSADPLSIGPPATERDVADTEGRIGRRLPLSLRSVLLEFSGSVCVSWHLYGAPERVREEAGRAFAGDVLVGLESLERAEATRRSACLRFDKPTRVTSESHDRWARSLAWWTLEGSAAGFDIRNGDADGPVVLLESEHHWPDCRAYLAPNFVEFMSRWTRACSVRPCSWILDDFVPVPWNGLDPDSAAVRRLRAALDLEL